jgi:hypothetical protein
MGSLARKLEAFQVLLVHSFKERTLLTSEEHQQDFWRIDES